MLAPSTWKAGAPGRENGLAGLILPALIRLAWIAASAAVFLAAWGLAAWLAQSNVLPAPAEVWRKFVLGVTKPQFAVSVAMPGWRVFEWSVPPLPYHIGVTLARVTASFALAMAAGSAIGLAMGRVETLNRLFDSWLILFLNLPAVVVIILCFLWTDYKEAAALAAVAINKIPNTAVTLREGARALDRDYLEMARLYGFGRWKTLRHVIAPQLAPYFAAAARSGLSLVWKIMLVAELMTRSSGVGYRLNLDFQAFDVAGVLAYTLAFVSIVLLIEAFILQPWERSVNRWRK